MNYRNIKPSIVNNYGYNGNATLCDMLLEPVTYKEDLDLWIKRLLWLKKEFAVVQYPDGKYTIATKFGII